MTKIKNTKKGMAKKTLSISLAVAMLATSNVPVWAAEFTDGSEAVFTSEVEAPVVEEAVEDVPSAQAEDSVYAVDIKNLGAEVQWGGAATPIKVKITDGDKNLTTSLKYRYLENGNNSLYNAYPLEDTDGDGYAEITPNFDPQYVGHTVQFQFFEGNTPEDGWSAKSTTFKVGKRAVTATAHFDVNQSNAVRYTGEQIALAREEIAGAVTDIDNFVGLDNRAELDDKAYLTSNWTATGKDTVNAVPDYSDETLKVHATGTFEDTNYKVTIKGDFFIWRKAFASIDDAVTVGLNKYEYEYTGNDIIVNGADVTVTDNVTKKVVADAAGDFRITTGFPGTKTVGIPVDMKKGSLANLAKINGTSDVDFGKTDLATPAKEVKIVPRDLSNTTNTLVSVDTITASELTQGKLNLETLKKNLVIKDADGTSLWNRGIQNGIFGSDINVYFKDAPTANEIAVETGKSYDVVIAAKTENVVKERTVTFDVIAYDLNDAWFDGGVLSDAANKENGKSLDTEYTGEKITYGLTAENMTAQLGDLRVSGDPNGVLVKGKSYEAAVSFGENTNAGEAQIIIKGIGDYAGTSKVVTFTINQRDLDNEDDQLVVPEKVLYNPNNYEAEDYTIDTSVVAKFTDVDVNNVANRTKTKEYTVTVPASEYEVKERTFEKVAPNADADNTVGNLVVTNAVRDAVAAAAGGNFGTFDFTNKTEIVNKSIAEADVTLTKTEYTYTAKEIEPEYTVVVDGETLVKDKDYTAQVTEGINVGEATLVITGMGDFDDTSVSKKFTIVPANVSALTIEADNVVYDGKQWIGTRTTEKLTFELGENPVRDNDKFTLNYPTSKYANINAGEATVTVKPGKDNKNFVGEATLKFQIAPAKVAFGTGILKAYNEKGTEVGINKAVEYDGTTHTFYSKEYTFDPTEYNFGYDNSKMKFTESDYEIIYRDNVVGKKEANGDQFGHLIVTLKGNYAVADSEYEAADGEVVKNVVKNEAFEIVPRDIGDVHTAVTVENGQYAAGKNVEPVVTITYKGHRLVKDVDYKLSYPVETKNCAVNNGTSNHAPEGNAANADRTEVTNGKTLTVHIDGIGGYYGYVKDNIAWGIDKFNIKNAEVIVTGTMAKPEVKVLNGSIVVPADEYEVTVSEDGTTATISAKADSKHYTGSKEVPFDAKPVGKAMIDRVDVVGNKATVVLSGEVDNAFGYDYVIATEEDYKNGRVDITKNQLKTTGDFFYVQKGVYYAYCHAYKRDPETGKKVFGGWSNIERFEVTATTPETPIITSVTRSGSTVKVTYKAAKNAEGYDIVLGSKRTKVNGELRPVEYGTLVKKNQTTTTVTFKNVPAGSYYVGLHAYNRTSVDNKKVFSPWANWSSRVTVR